ncbi:hypothetical protein C8R43DRAFT_949288 [Mycena crocata]|nr:hypothetical protein C8R43DRAFT_949288 [Mycena crocata]
MAGPALRGLVHHGPYFMVPVPEMPLTTGMVKNMTGLARRNVDAKRFSCYPSGAKSRQALYIVPDDLLKMDLSNAFPNGFYSVRVSRVSATGFRLDTTWRICFDTGRFWAPVNECIQAKFGVKWRGNIVMMKHYRGSEQIMQVARQEEQAADLILSLSRIVRSGRKEFAPLDPTITLTPAYESAVNEIFVAAVLPLILFLLISIPIQKLLDPLRALLLVLLVVSGRSSQRRRHEDIERLVRARKRAYATIGDGDAKSFAEEAFETLDDNGGDDGGKKARRGDKRWFCVMAWRMRSFSPPATGVGAARGNEVEGEMGGVDICTDEVDEGWMVG